MAKATRISIDPNVRIEHNWTYSLVDLADGPISVGQAVEAYESEANVSAPARVERVEPNGIVCLSVDWSAMRDAYDG